MSGFLKPRNAHFMTTLNSSIIQSVLEATFPGNRFALSDVEPGAGSVDQEMVLETQTQVRPGSA